MKNNAVRKVELREGGLGDIAKPLCETKDPKHWGDTICGRIDPTYSWDRSTDKLSTKMPKINLEQDLGNFTYTAPKVEPERALKPGEIKAMAKAIGLASKGANQRQAKELASTPTDTVAEIREAAMSGQVVSLSHLANAIQREKQPAPEAPKGAQTKAQEKHNARLQQQTDSNVNLERATNVLRSELGVKTSGDVAKLQVVHVAPPRVVKPVDAPKHPRKARPEITGTDMVDGRKFGKWIVTLRRRQDKRACQHIGKRLLVIAGRNVGRGQIFYLAAAYGVLESR